MTRWAALGLGAAALLGGCATNDDVLAVRRDMAALRNEVATLSRTNQSARDFTEERLKKAEADMRGRVESSLKESEGSRVALNQRVEEMTTETRFVQGKLEENASVLRDAQTRLDEVDQRLDDLLVVAGAVNVEFPLKTACCGGAHTLSDSDTSTKLVLNIIRAAEAAGAEVIATECPTCHSGLEMHQVRAEKKFGQATRVKIVYFTQLLGLTLGLKPKQVGIHENISDSMEFLRGKGIA